MPEDTPQLPDTAFHSVLQVLRALHTLVHAWAITGTVLRSSQKEQTQQVRDADLSECLAYHAFCVERAMNHPGPEYMTVRWLVELDRQTRSKARFLHLHGWPWGEALREAREKHLAVAWTNANTGISQGVPISLPAVDDVDDVWPLESHQPLAITNGPSTWGGQGALTVQDCCPAFNSQSGCGRQQDCPHNKRHVCSWRKEDGTICGRWQHGRHICNLNPDRPLGRRFRASPKSKGANKGKGKGRGKGKVRPSFGKGKNVWQGARNR